MSSLNLKNVSQTSDQAFVVKMTDREANLIRNYADYERFVLNAADDVIATLGRQPKWKTIGIEPTESLAKWLLPSSLEEHDAYLALWNDPDLAMMTQTEMLDWRRTVLVEAEAEASEIGSMSAIAGLGIAATSRQALKSVLNRRGLLIGTAAAALVSAIPTVQAQAVPGCPCEVPINTCGADCFGPWYCKAHGFRKNTFRAGCYGFCQTINVGCHIECCLFTCC